MKFTLIIRSFCFLIKKKNKKGIIAVKIRKYNYQEINNWKKSLKYSAKLDESNAETIPNNKIIEIDLGINSFVTDSDAANRY